MPLKPIPVIAGLSGEAERAVREAINGLVNEINLLGQGLRLTPLKTSSYNAREGEVVRMVAGKTLNLPRARQENQNAEIGLMLETPGSVRVTSTQSKIDGSDVITIDRVGLTIFLSNGNGSWFSTDGTTAAQAAIDAIALVGAAGATGATGAQGQQGFPGLDGVDGQDGAPGQAGVAGAAGSAGATGPAGPQGFPGQDGFEGPEGQPGVPGVAGAAGAAGANGAAGAQGFPGADGQDGQEGPQGQPGPMLSQVQDSGVTVQTQLQGINFVDGSGSTAIVTAGPGGIPTVTFNTGAGGTTLMALTEVEKNLGPGLMSGSFTITGLSGLTVGTNVLIVQLNGPYTGKGTLADEAEDQVSVSAQVTSATVITAYWESLNGPIFGNVKFGYAVGSTITLTNLGTAPPHSFLGNPTNATAVRVDTAATLGGQFLVYDSIVDSLRWKTVSGDGLSEDAQANLSVEPLNDGSLYVTGQGVGFRKSRRRHWFFDDFSYVGDVEFGTSATPFMGDTPWAGQRGGGAGPGAAFTTGVADHPGILTLDSIATIGSSATIFKGGSVTSAWLVGADIYSAEMVFNAPSNSNVYVEFGFFTAPLITYTNAIFFYFDNPADTSVHVFTEEAGVSTDTDTGFVLASGAWTVFTMIQETAGTIDFYINDALELSTSSNVPDTEVMNLGVSVLSRAATAKTLQIDYVSFESQDLVVRF